jgi:HK97 family phage major capsid protein
MSPVDLNDEDAVRAEARAELDRQAMAQYRRDLEGEDSRRRARQGAQLIYRRNGEHSYFLDIARRAINGHGGPDIEKRLRDHGNQIRLHSGYGELRGLDETLGAGGSFAAPEYVQSEFQAAAHPLRATADVCKRLTVPANRSQIVVPTFQSGSSDGITTSQNTTITEGDPSDAAVSCSTAPISGKVTASRQLIEQASPDSRVDDVISADLGAAYGAQLDAAVLTGSGSGQMTGLLNLSGVSTVAAGSSVAGLVDGIVTGYQTMVQTRYRKPNVCIMHPRRWLSGFANGIDVQGRPLMLPSTHPAALMGTPDDGVVAEWLGMKIILDVNVPTTSGNGSQDYVILGHSPDWLLYESLPNFQAYMQTLAGQMSVLLVAMQYAALAVRYPSSVCLVGPFNAPTTPGS